MSLVKFNAIGVDPSLDTRMILKQAALALPEFRRVDFVNTTAELIDRLKSKETDPIDILFLSYRLPDDELAKVTKEAKESVAGRDAAFVLLLRNEDQNNGLVASKLLLGVDGFLFEPYSVDNLKEIAALSAQVKRARSKAREVSAVTYLVYDLASDITKVAYLKSCRLDVGPAWRGVKEKARSLLQLSPEALQVYYDVAVDVFVAIEPTAAGFAPYNGVSSRLRKRMAARILTELDKAGEVEKDN